MHKEGPDLVSRCSLRVWYQQAAVTVVVVLMVVVVVARIGMLWSLSRPGPFRFSLFSLRFLAIPVLLCHS